MYMLVFYYQKLKFIFIINLHEKWHEDLWKKLLILKRQRVHNNTDANVLTRNNGNSR